MTPTELRYLEALSYRFPSIAKASTEIINLSSILELPKGTENFISDVHGEYEQFVHIIRNASGNIRIKIEEEFGFELSREDKTELATLIYYPEDKMNQVESEGVDMLDWYRTALLRMVRMARRTSNKYTRSKVRKAIPEDFRYVIEELMSENDAPDKVSYYDSVLAAIVSTGQARACIAALADTICRLAVDHLHILGDVYDRGPGPHIILQELINFHSVDIQWGNHDIIWMGAACGHPLCVATVLRLSARYANLDILEDGYGINLIPLMRLAVEDYSDTDLSMFRIKHGEDYNESDAPQDMRMHKAAAMLQFKLEGQWIHRHPEFEMDDRMLLDKIDYEQKTLTVYGHTYHMEDTDFPTVNPRNPYALTEKERDVIDRLCAAFRGSDKLQEHMRFLLGKGSLYLKSNNNLLYHGCVPVNADGSFHALELGGQSYAGKALMDVMDSYVRRAFFSTDREEREYAQDLIYYLWCGPWSPLFGKERMTTFERQFIRDKAAHEEPKSPYYLLYNDESVMRRIYEEFGLDWEHSRIVSGHIPIKSSHGESPVKCGGRLLMIDGGFSRAYQPETGIAGYTLSYNSKGLKLVAHQPFSSKQNAVLTGQDIHSTTTLLERLTDRVTVGDTDIGQYLRDSISDLRQLLAAYRSGLISEK